MLKSTCNVVSPLPSRDGRYAFGCLNGIVYNVRILLGDQLELKIETEMINDPSNKTGVKDIIFGDFDGDGEVELGLLRQDNQIQVWQLFQNEPMIRLGRKYFQTRIIFQTFFIIRN